MKRKLLIKKLREAGFFFKEGSEHTKVYDHTGAYRCTIGRHTEIPEALVRLIEKQTQIALLK